MAGPARLSDRKQNDSRHQIIQFNSNLYCHPTILTKHKTLILHIRSIQAGRTTDRRDPNHQQANFLQLEDTTHVPGVSESGAEEKFSRTNLLNM